VVADEGGQVLRGGEGAAPDDDEQPSATVDPVAADEAVQQGPGQERVAAAVPAQVDDQPVGAGGVDRGEEPLDEGDQRFVGIVGDPIELEIRQALGASEVNQ